MSAAARHHPNGAIGWGILGSGRMARTMAAAISSTPGARLAAVASRDATRAQEFARAVGAAQGHARYSELLADPAVTVVYIATPNHRHHHDCLAALRAGKAVLCEKPLATTAAEAREIAAEAERTGLFCMEAMWTHLLPAVMEAERRIKAGEIGTPLLVSGSFGLPTVLPPGSALLDPNRGGGALLDRGCYPISLALRFLGAVAEVRGLRRTNTTQSDGASADTAAVATIGFQGGGLAVISASLTALTANDLVISGTGGRLVLSEPVTNPQVLSLTRAQAEAKPSEPGFKADAKGGLRGRVAGWVKRGPLAVPLRLLLRQRHSFMSAGADPFIHQIAEVQRCLAAGWKESTVVPLSLSIATLDVIDALRRS